MPLTNKYEPVRPLFAHFSQVSSVTMPASFPPQLAELHQKPSAPALTFFVRWGLNRHNSVSEKYKLKCSPRRYIVCMSQRQI